MSQIGKLRLREVNWFGSRGEARIPTQLGGLVISYSNYCRKHFSAHRLPTPVHSAFQIFFCLITAITVFWGTYFYPHFVDHAVETETSTRPDLAARNCQRNLRGFPAGSGWFQRSYKQLKLLYFLSKEISNTNRESHSLNPFYDKRFIRVYTRDCQLWLHVRIPWHFGNNYSCLGLASSVWDMAWASGFVKFSRWFQKSAVITAINNKTPELGGIPASPLEPSQFTSPNLGFLICDMDTAYLRGCLWD